MSRDANHNGIPRDICEALSAYLQRGFHDPAQAVAGQAVAEQAPAGHVVAKQGNQDRAREKQDAAENAERAAIVARFRRDLERVRESAAAGGLPLRPRSVPPTRGLTQLSRAVQAALRDCPTHADEVRSAACRALGWAAWTEFYEEDSWSAGFVSRFAGGTLIGPDAPWRDESLIVDVFVYGPEIHYPPHAHPAEEIYLILGGGPAEISLGSQSVYAGLDAGRMSVHRSNEAHAIRVGREPIFGVVMYRGDLAGPLWYRERMDDDSETKKYPKVVRPADMPGKS
jgi:hypothetical protein